MATDGNDIVLAINELLGSFRCVVAVGGEPGASPPRRAPAALATRVTPLVSGRPCWPRALHLCSAVASVRRKKGKEKKREQEYFGTYTTLSFSI